VVLHPIKAAELSCDERRSRRARSDFESNPLHHNGPAADFLGPIRSKGLGMGCTRRAEDTPAEVVQNSESAYTQAHGRVDRNAPPTFGNIYPGHVVLGEQSPPSCYFFFYMPPSCPVLLPDVVSREKQRLG
jgi:hypothetical protein